MKAVLKVQLIFGTALAGILASLATTASANEQIPCETLRWIVPFSAGGGVDWATRLVSGSLSERLGGVSVIIDNRPGATGAVGAKEALNAPADGCTIMSMTNSMLVNQVVKGTEETGFDLLTEFQPVVSLATTPYFITANADLGVTNLPELIALAKEKPGEIPYSTTGNASLQAMTYGLLSSLAGIEMIEIPYKGGGEMFADFLSGRVPLFLAYPYEVADYVKEGKVNYIAVTSPERHPLLPDVPAVAETLPGYEIMQTYGVITRAGAPADVVASINKAITESLNSEEVSGKLKSETSFLVNAGTPEAYGEKLASDAEKFKTIASDVGLNQ